MAYNETLRERYRNSLAEIKENGLFKQERFISGPQGAEIEVEYPAGSPVRRVITMCANNYLGLSSHPDIIRAAHQGLDQWGYGMSSVRFICGTQSLHKDLERVVSRFLDTEDTILFSSCFDANGAVFEALLDENDIMISDRLVHASIIDGMRLAKAQHDTYKHSDMAHLGKKLEQYQNCPRKMVITDGVFSMDGDVARLDEIVRLAEQFDAMVFVDDSHATGFMGRTGRGTHELCNVMGRVDIITTTFGKALGGASGGCVSGRSELVELLRQKGRPYLFSNTLSSVITAATLEAFRLLTESTERRDKLEENTRYWRKGLIDLGFVLKDGESPIVPVMLFNAKLAQEISIDLYQEGVYAIGFFFPVVPQGQARIRTQLSAAHTREHLDTALAAFETVGRKHGILGLTKDQLIEKYGL
jgi:glycine C-acetyltransferase